MAKLEQIDEDTYRFGNLYLKKEHLDAMRKAITNSMTEEKLHKIYDIIMYSKERRMYMTKEEVLEIFKQKAKERNQTMREHKAKDGTTYYTCGELNVRRLAKIALALVDE